MFKKKEEVWSEKEVANAKAVSTASPSWASLFNFTTRNHTVPLALGTILATASGIVMPTTSIFLGKIFDNFTSFAGGLITSSALTTRITTDCIALIGLGCGTWLLNGGYFLFWMLFGELQARSVRDKLFGSLLEKDMEWFDKRKNGIGAHIPRFQAQIRELQLATAQPLGFLVQSVATALASLGIAFYYSWNLSLVTLATIPLSALILATISSRMQPSIDAQELQLSRASKHAHNVISAIETVKCLNGETFEVDQYSSCIQEAAKNYLAQARANALQIGFVRIMTLGMFIQGFWYGSTLVGAGKKSAGDILTTFWACLMATQAIEQILPQLMVLERGKAAGAVLKAVITQVERRRRVVRMAGGRRPSSCFGDIKMKNVCFTYPTCPDQMVLNDASLQFPANETTFVIGKSGSGKSTLGNLLLKLYSPASGDISIDGNPLQILNDDWIRNNITLVQQQSVLFNESLSTNVGFGKQIHGDASSQEIKEACEFALLQTAIRDLPRGLETRLGNGGSSLSGGQRQRVAIARARLRDTPILILDESTSALDPTSRSLVLDAIRHWRRGKTTIIITHDISQICATDYVYVMDGGRVVQEGIRGHLEEIADGLFASFAPRKDSTVSTVEPGEQGLLDIESPQYVEFIDDARVFPTASISSQDSLEIDYYQPTRFIPSVFAGHLDGDQSPRRRLSDNLLSPLSPVYQSTARSSLLDFPPVPISPLQCSLRRPSLGLVEASGTTTLMRRTIDGGTDRKSQRISTHSRAAIAQKPMRLDCRFLKNHKSEQTTEEKARRAAPIKKILGTVWPILSWQQRTLLILGFLAAFAHAVATPIFSWTFSKLLATFSLQSGRSEEVLKWSLAVLGVAIGDAIASYSMNYLLQCCGQAWVDVIRVEALKRIIVQPRSWFERDKNKLSQLVEYLDRNAEEMKNLVGRSAGLVFAAMTMVVVSTIWSLVVSWKLTLVGLATAPIMYAVTRCFEYVSARWEARSNEGAEEAGSILTETFTNIRIVRALTLEEYFHDKFTKCTIRNLRTGVKRSAYSGLFFGLSDSGIIFITALIFYYGAVLVSNGEYPPAEILTVFTMLLFGIARANSIVSFVPQISSARDTATRLLRLSHLPARRSHECRGTHRIQDPLPIVFNNASFTYPSRKALPVLSRLSLSFPSGSMTAIVGSSGSGKSTIASLLLRLYPPDSSSTDGPGLTLGGVDIQDVLTPSLRAVVALVPQTPFLFPMSIAQNIAYALPALSPLAYPASIEAASKAAGIHDFIMSLPMGYGTLVGDGGQGLSGGQAQRIAIARALIRRPRLLILDEATSALDAESARWFRGVMVRINRQGSVPGADPVTIIAITHDKEMMKTCGDVVVIDQGRVVETGAYKELSRRRGGKLRRLLKGGAPFES